MPTDPVSETIDITLRVPYAQWQDFVAACQVHQLSPPDVIQQALSAILLMARQPDTLVAVAHGFGSVFGAHDVHGS